MKLLFENWREYLNEGFDYSKYYISMDEDPTEKSYDQGKLENLVYLSLLNEETHEEVMSFYIQRYSGLVGHSDFRTVNAFCRKKTQGAPQEAPPPPGWPVSEAWPLRQQELLPGTLDYWRTESDCTKELTQDLNFKSTGNDYLYSGGFNVGRGGRGPSDPLVPGASSELGKFALGSLAAALRETAIAVMREKYGAKYYAHHDAVAPGASTSTHAQRLIDFMVKRGFLKPTNIEEWAPTHPSETDFPWSKELAATPWWGDHLENEKEYTIFEITPKAQIRFKVD